MCKGERPPLVRLCIHTHMYPYPYASIPICILTHMHLYPYALASYTHMGTPAIPICTSSCVHMHMHMTLCTHAHVHPPCAMDHGPCTMLLYECSCAHAPMCTCTHVRMLTFMHTHRYLPICIRTGTYLPICICTGM